MAREIAPRYVNLPGKTPARCDANVIVCVRIDPGTETPLVVVHTDKGFAFGLIPFDDITIERFYEKVVQIVWPNEAGRIG